MTVASYTLAGRPSRKRRDPDRLLPRPMVWLILGVASLVVLIPVCYMVVVSLAPESQVDSGRVVPSKLVWSNYASIWSQASLARGVANSILIAGLSALLAVAVASAAAYPLARYRFAGRRSFLYSVMGVQLVPGAMILLPVYVIYSAIQTAVGVHVIGSYWAMILTYLTFALPFALWLMVNYMMTIPRSLEEAALVDGCSPAGALVRVVMPMATPGLVVSFLFSFLLGWNDVLFASILTNSRTETLAVAIQVFSVSQFQVGAAGPRLALLLAAGVVSAVPVVVIYLLFQRYLVTGLSAGAVR